jgi:hypothetical protein
MISDSKNCSLGIRSSWKGNEPWGKFNVWLISGEEILNDHGLNMFSW